MERMMLPYTLNYFVLMFPEYKENDFVFICGIDNPPSRSLFFSACLWGNYEDAQRYADKYSNYDLKVFNAQINLYTLGEK